MELSYLSSKLTISIQPLQAKSIKFARQSVIIQ
jgi:hypothetical protein